MRVRIDDLQRRGRSHTLPRKEEQDSGLVEERNVGGVGKLPPVGERFERHPRVDLVGAVGAAGHPGLAAGRSAGMRRRICIEEEDLLPLVGDLRGGNETGEAFFDDDDVSSSGRYGAMSNTL